MPSDSAVTPTAKLRLLEQRQVDHRVLGGQFPDHQEDQGDQGDQAEGEDHRRGEPVMVVAVVEHELQAADTGDQQYQADDVDGRAGDLRFALAQQRPGDHARRARQPAR